MCVEGHKEPLMVKFADGGNKKKLQCQSMTWPAGHELDVRNDGNNVTALIHRSCQFPSCKSLHIAIVSRLRYRRHCAK